MGTVFQTINANQPEGEMCKLAFLSAVNLVHFFLEVRKLHPGWNCRREHPDNELLANKKWTRRWSTNVCKKASSSPAEAQPEVSWNAQPSIKSRYQSWLEANHQWLRVCARLINSHHDKSILLRTLQQLTRLYPVMNSVSIHTESLERKKTDHNR